MIKYAVMKSEKSYKSGRSQVLWVGYITLYATHWVRTVFI